MLNLNDIFDDHDFNLEDYNNNLLAIENYNSNPDNKTNLEHKAQFDKSILIQQEKQHMLGKIFYTLIAATKENAETYLLMKDRALTQNRKHFTHQNHLFNLAIQAFNNYIDYGSPQNIEEILNEIKSSQVDTRSTSEANNNGIILLNEYCRNSRSGYSYHKLFQKHSDLILALAKKHSNDPHLVVEELSTIHQLPIFNDFGENAVKFFKQQSSWTFGSNNPFSRKKRAEHND